MLMRLARGSGTGGLAAPRPVQEVGNRVHLRPLLGMKKEAIVESLRRSGIRWRDDRTNSGGKHFRNRVRNRVVPVWQQAAGRDAAAGAALSRELLEEDDSALETWVDELRPVARDGTLDLDVLKGRPRAVVRRAVRRWLRVQPHVGGLSRRGFDDLLAVVLSGRPDRRSLGRKGFAVVKDNRLRYERARLRKGSGRKRTGGR
jgi:tRNA(Ile)-lysidine synthase